MKYKYNTEQIEEIIKSLKEEQKKIDDSAAIIRKDTTVDIFSLAIYYTTRSKLYLEDINKLIAGEYNREEFYNNLEKHLDEHKIPEFKTYGEE